MGWNSFCLCTPQLEMKQQGKLSAQAHLQFKRLDKLLHYLLNNCSDFKTQNLFSVKVWPISLFHQAVKRSGDDSKCDTHICMLLLWTHNMRSKASSAKVCSKPSFMQYFCYIFELKVFTSVASCFFHSIFYILHMQVSGYLVQIINYYYFDLLVMSSNLDHKYVNAQLKKYFATMRNEIFSM